MKNYLHLFLSLLIFCCGTVFAQQEQVSGVVISGEDNEPIIGASITVKGNTTIGTVTDFDGKFHLEIPSGTKAIIVSYIGMKSQEAAPKKNMRIVLQTAAEELKEVVVTGMQKMDKRLFTGAATKIEADKAKLDGVADVSRALEGRAAGVSVQNVSGTFGTAPKIRVRGATSIYGNSTPLWVVDGVVMEDAVEISSDELSSGDAQTLIASAISGLNADDIESFDILKDGSATSIYGARAMAGVVVITTKKGRAGVSRLNYTGEFTYRMKPSYNNFNISNSQEQMGIYKEMEEKGWLEFANIAQSSSGGVYRKMYDLANTYYGNDEYGVIQKERFKNQYLRNAEYINTDWFDILFDNNLMMNHAVSLSSGTEKAKFYSSMSVMTDPGWSKSSDVSRYTFNANGSYNILNNLTVSLLGNGSYRKQKAPGTLSQETDVVSGEVKRDFDINPYSYALNTSRSLDPNVFYKRNYTDFNILHELDNNYIDLNLTELKFQGDINYKPIRGLELIALAAMKYQSTAQEHHIKDFSNQAEAYRAGVYPDDATIRQNNPLLYKDPDDPTAQPKSILPQGGIYNRTEYSMRGFDFRATAAYNTSFAEDTHIMNLFGGTEISSIDRNRTWFRGWGYQYENGGIPFYDFNAFKQGKEENADYYTNTWTYSRNAAFFAMGTYSYKGRYTVNGTIRYEGSNKLGKSRSARWLPTWNVSGAWNAHEETWFPELFGETWTHATLKSSYSLTADRGPSFVTNSNAIYSSYTPWRPLASVSESGMYLDGLENSELTYEKKREFNIGADLGFLNNRINASFDFYTRRNHDLIGMINTSGVGGEITKYANVASMKSHGYELTISTKNIQNKDFSWSTDFIFSQAKNEITDLDSRSNVLNLVSGSGYAREGYPVRSLFSIPFLRLNNQGLPVFTNEDGSETITGIYFQNFSNLDYLKYEGPTDPTITGSFGNLFTWKNFKLNVFITYSFGNKIRLDQAFSSSYTDLSSMPKEFKNRWVMPGDEKITNIPTIADRRLYKIYGNDIRYAYNAYNFSTERVADGGFIRMKEISLTYDFPKAWLENAKINNLALKVQATNLFLIYADKKLNGQDPEFFNTGGVAAPVPKQFTFTIRLGI